MPARSATSGRWLDGPHVVTGTGEKPGDEGIGVPHVTAPDFVAAPRERGDCAKKFEQAGNLPRVITKSLRTPHSFRHIGDVPAEPAPNFVPEEPVAA